MQRDTLKLYKQVAIIETIMVVVFAPESLGSDLETG